MKDITGVAGLAYDSSTYVAASDPPWVGLQRSTRPFLVDGDIAAYSLGAIGAEGVPPLMGLLADADYRLRVRAVMGLGMAEGAAEPAVPALIKALNDPELEVRIGAADALGCIGKRPDLAIPALITALTNPAEGVDYYAAQSLGDFRQAATNAIPALLVNFTSGDYRTEDSAALALGKISPEVSAKDVIPVLLRDLQGSRPPVNGSQSANMSLITLSQMKDEEGLVIPAIIKVIDDPKFNSMDRKNAISALGRFGPAAGAAVTKLNGLTNDPDLQVREEAMRALQKIEPRTSL